MSGDSISGYLQFSDIDAPMPDDSGVTNQLPSEMPDPVCDFFVPGSGETISGDIGCSDMDAPMSNDSGDLCQRSGNSIKTGMRFDMSVRKDKDSSRLASLYMPFVSVIHQLFGVFNSEFD